MAAAAIFHEPSRVDSLSSSLISRSTAAAHRTSFKRRRGKTVSWPSEDKICQVQFFLADDSPSTLGSAQHVLQWNFVGKSIMKKASLCETLDIPPGFHCSWSKRARVNPVAELPFVVERPWYPPPKFVMDSSWWTAEGGESIEVSLQQQRELRVLEAFYPRLSCIPDSPAEPPEHCDYSLPSTTPVIPLEEDGENVEEADCEAKGLDKEGHADVVSLEPEKNGEVQNSELCLLGSGRSMPPQLDGKAAIAAACMSVANGLVDQELLVEILQNPALLKNLMSSKQPFNDVKEMSTNRVGVGNVGQTSVSLNKQGVGFSSSSGLPSPVSVLAEWTEASTPKPSPGISPNLSERRSKSNVIDVGSQCQGLHPSAGDNPYPTPNEGSLKLGLGERGLGWAYANKAVCDPNMDVHSSSDRHGNRLDAVVCSASQASSASIRNRPLTSNVVGGMCSAQSSLPTALHQHIPQDSRALRNEVSGLPRSFAKTKRLCMYYNTPRGCRKGGYCDFLHQ